MKTIKIISISILFCLSFLKTKADPFDDMLIWINQTNAPLSSYPGILKGQYNCYKYDMLMTNNTIRSNADGKYYQYCSFSGGEIYRCPEEQPKKELIFMKIGQSFSKEENLYPMVFNCKARDYIDVRIFREGKDVKVSLKLLSWGNALHTYKASIRPTALNGFVIQFENENREFFTITLTRNLVLVPG